MPAGVANTLPDETEETAVDAGIPTQDRETFPW